MGLIKSNFDLEHLRKAGNITAIIVDHLGKMVKPGVSAGDLERKAREMCAEYGVESSFFGYQGYEYFTCIGVNDEVVHALPIDSKIFADGDLVKVDFGAQYRGYYGDHCRTFAVGTLSPIHKKLLEAGEAATANAVKLARAGARIGDLSHAMQSTAEAAGFEVVRMYIGHGIGKHMHEAPEIPAFGEPGTGMELKPNMVMCIECQVCENSGEVMHDRDGWTARTKDGGYAVMFESMVAITEKGCEVLSRV